MRSLGWALIQYGRCPYKRGIWMHTKAQKMIRKVWGGGQGNTPTSHGMPLDHQELGADPPLRGLEGIDPADTVMSHFQPPEWEALSICVFKPLSLWCKLGLLRQLGWTDTDGKLFPVLVHLGAHHGPAERGLGSPLLEAAVLTEGHQDSGNPQSTGDSIPQAVLDTSGFLSHLIFPIRHLTPILKNIKPRWESVSTPWPALHSWDLKPAEAGQAARLTRHRVVSSLDRTHVEQASQSQQAGIRGLGALPQTL